MARRRLVSGSSERSTDVAVAVASMGTRVPETHEPANLPGPTPGGTT